MTFLRIGNIKLHINNLALASGASNEELPLLKKLLIERLENGKK